MFINFGGNIFIFKIIYLILCAVFIFFNLESFLLLIHILIYVSIAYSFYKTSNKIKFILTLLFIILFWFTLTSYYYILYPLFTSYSAIYLSLLFFNIYNLVFYKGIIYNTLYTHVYSIFCINALGSVYTYTYMNDSLTIIFSAGNIKKWR